MAEACVFYYDVVPGLAVRVSRAVIVIRVIVVGGSADKRCSLFSNNFLAYCLFGSVITLLQIALL